MNVEFLPGEPPPPVEPPPARRWHGLGRVGWAAVVVVVAAAAVAWVLTRPSDHTDVAVDPTAGVKQVRLCHGVPDCAYDTTVPELVASAVLEQVPGAQISVTTVASVSSMTGSTLIVRRDIEAVAGSATVFIRLQRGGTERGPLTADPLGFRSLMLRRVTLGFVARLEYLAPDGHPPPVRHLRALLADPRLAANT